MSAIFCSCVEFAFQSGDFTQIKLNAAKNQPRFARKQRSDRDQTAIIFIASSPKWLIAFTAIRPLFGGSNGREQRPKQF
ncbi:MAG: hypothetical protein LBO72_04420 [Helicobacteraceae bacterium]|jgi:hypothetical protein|nr:hypothetical protein [Helicobacteraceae bacterium]